MTQWSIVHFCQGIFILLDLIWFLCLLVPWSERNPKWSFLHFLSPFPWVPTSLLSWYVPHKHHWSFKFIWIVSHSPPISRKKERKKELKEKKNNFHALRYVHTYGRESSELIELMMFNTLPHTDNVINVPFLCEDYPVLG